LTEDYYKTLQVDPSADPEVITAAYRRLAVKYHPDTNRSPDATLRMQKINEAYRILSNPIERARYDKTHPGANGAVAGAARHNVAHTNAQRNEQAQSILEAEAEWNRTVRMADETLKRTTRDAEIERNRALREAEDVWNRAKRMAEDSYKRAVRDAEVERNRIVRDADDLWNRAKRAAESLGYRTDKG
jgi:DnaJ-class molecular chaperone